VVPSCGFTFRMAFESMLGPKSCEGFLLLNFTTRFRSDTFVAVFEEGSFLKNYVLFYCLLCIFAVATSFCTLWICIGFHDCTSISVS
jgi:hypothetical protein